MCCLALSHAKLAMAGPIGYTLGAGSLYSFDLALPGVVNTVGTISGAVTSLDSIDFRPANGLLYGYSISSHAIVTVNPLNAVTTFVSTPTATLTSPRIGIDFNPVSDRLRLVSLDDENQRIDVSTGATINDGAFIYAPGDPFALTLLNVSEVAYTNSDTNPATDTTLYYIDYFFGNLVTTSNSNSGILNTVGSLGFGSTSAVSSFMGFDILSDGYGKNTAYAILDPSGSRPRALYQIDLATGAATSRGTLGNGSTTYNSLAIVQPQIPEPCSLSIACGLMIVGLHLNCRSRRRP